MRLILYVKRRGALHAPVARIHQTGSYNAHLRPSLKNGLFQRFTPELGEH